MKINRIETYNNYSKIIFFDKYFLIDNEDVDKIKNKEWFFGRGTRVYTKLQNKNIELKRYIMDYDGDDKIFLINNSIPDYRKNNLSIGVKGNIIKLYDNYAEIYVQGDKYIIDIEDVTLISKYTWRKDKDGYLTTFSRRNEQGKQKKYILHRLILEVDDYHQVDHINRNIHDNRKNNLRIVVLQQNIWNRSKSKSTKSEYKGVFFDKKANVYVARIGMNKKSIYIGSFSNKIAAVNAYNYYAKLYHKEYAVLNEVDYMAKEEWEKYKSQYQKTSKYRGVSLDKKRNKWRVYTQDKNKKIITLGTFNTEEEAAIKYDEYLINNFNFDDIKRKLNFSKRVIEYKYNFKEGD